MKRPALALQSRIAEPDWMKLASSIRDHLQRERISPEDIAIVLGVHEATARNRWHGRTPWRMDELLAVSALIDIPLSHLLLDHEIRLASDSPRVKDIEE